METEYDLRSGSDDDDNDEDDESGDNLENDYGIMVKVVEVTGVLGESDCSDIDDIDGTDDMMALLMIGAAAGSDNIGPYWKSSTCTPYFGTIVND
jgi:hypothetical protein